ncbi:hypothetical protein ACIQAA_29415 [Neobacillus sp. NPDC093182]|uniref:hypothetical protein n=1 Tax=Neobacillus sp. NPDC093182 TaxID=3364297 RepID=UPI00380ED87A
MARENFVNQINGKDLSNNEIKRIENSLQTINEKFHTFESIAIYEKKTGINNFQYYFDLDLKDAEYLFLLNTVKKDNLITEGFRVVEGLEAGEYYVVHYYYPGWFFLIPIALFIVSGVLFLIWLIPQIKQVYTTRLFKPQLN